jgi:outer membrane protein OmpU
MNKLTKIGVSALAGSLVAASAQAGELSASGTWELTYKSDDKTQTGNPFGSKSGIALSGSGDVDGLGTASFTAVINDNNPAGYLSHLITLDMGDMGMVGFDQGYGKFGAGTIDDKSPTAWEESWHNTANSSGGLVHSGGSGGVLGYSNSMGGFDLTVEYAPALTTADNGDGAAGGDNTSIANGSNINFAVNNSTLIEGLTFGFGAGSSEYDDEAVVGMEDGSSVVGYANYVMGPATIGVTLSDSNNARQAAATTSSTPNANAGGREVEAYGIAFAVNENLSISYNEHNMTYKKKNSDGADVEQESTGIAIAYTMGGATLAIQNNSMDNVTGTVGTNDEITEISLSLAF